MTSSGPLVDTHGLTKSIPVQRSVPRDRALASQHIRAGSSCPKNTSCACLHRARFLALLFSLSSFLRTLSHRKVRVRPQRSTHTAQPLGFLNILGSLLTHLETLHLILANVGTRKITQLQGHESSTFRGATRSPTPKPSKGLWRQQKRFWKRCYFSLMDCQCHKPCQGNRYLALSVTVLSWYALARTTGIAVDDHRIGLFVLCFPWGAVQLDRCATVMPWRDLVRLLTDSLFSFCGGRFSRVSWPVTRLQGNIGAKR